VSKEILRSPSANGLSTLKLIIYVFIGGLYTSRLKIYLCLIDIHLRSVDVSINKKSVNRKTTEMQWPKRKKKGQSTNNRPQNTTHKFNIKQHKSQGKCKLFTKIGGACFIGKIGLALSFIGRYSSLGIEHLINGKSRVCISLGIYVA
jgi:hypothetical protein